MAKIIYLIECLNRSGGGERTGCIFWNVSINAFKDGVEHL